MDGRSDFTMSVTVRRRKGASILIFKKVNQAICRSRTDRVRGIFKAYQTLRQGTPGFKSGRREVKYWNSNSRREYPILRLQTAIVDRVDSDTIEKTKDLAVQRKRLGMKKLPPFELQRIRFGKRLMRKRKNAEKWSYSPGMEPDYNVEVEYFGEDEYDEDDDEDGDEYWYKEDENDWFPPYMFKKCYRRFNASGKRPYLVWLEKEEYEVEEMID